MYLKLYFYKIKLTHSDLFEREDTWVRILEKSERGDNKDFVIQKKNI